MSSAEIINNAEMERFSKLIRARYYDPKIRRFTTEDSYWGRANDPMSLNIYVYCTNNPVMYVDPSGHQYTEAVALGGAWLPVFDGPLPVGDIIYVVAVSGTAVVEYGGQYVGAAVDVAADAFAKGVEVSKDITEKASQVAKDVGVKAVKGLIDMFGGGSGGQDPNKFRKDEKNSNKVELSRAQARNLDTLDNIVDGHMTDMDFSGTLRDLQGNPVPKPSGGYWNHLQEMKDSYKGLLKIQKGLEGSLKNPTLNNATRKVLQNGIKKASIYIDKIVDLFEPFGGIK